MTTLGLAALGEATAAYGIEFLDNYLKPLWVGICLHLNKRLSAFLRALDSWSALHLIQRK